MLDTDTFNEVDDQFALAHLLLSVEQIDFEAVYAAPFHNSRSTGPADGMEKSYHEILRIYEFLAGVPHPPVFRGSREFLSDSAIPPSSPAAADLVERAMAPNAEKLTVVAIAAATNLAAAILMEPRIAERIEVIWLGGNSPHWPFAREFNLRQDLTAARVLLDGPVSLKWLPCFPVTSHLVVTIAELESHLKPHGALGDYLTKSVRRYREQYPGSSKEIWDIGATAWALNPEWIRTIIAPSPILNDNLTWTIDPNRRLIETALWPDRKAIFRDFFTKVQQYAAAN